MSDSIKSGVIEVTLVGNPGAKHQVVMVRVNAIAYIGCDSTGGAVIHFNGLREPLPVMESYEALRLILLGSA